MNDFGRHMDNPTGNPALAPIASDVEWNFQLRRVYAGDVLYTEGMTGDHMFLIKDGEVELCLMREEKQVVVATLGKGQCFGMMPQLLNGRRSTKAIAKCYCELYVIDSYLLIGLLDQTPKLIRSILATLAQRIADSNELIAKRVNYQPEIMVYANLLQLVGMANSNAARKSGGMGAAPAQPQANPTLSEVLGYARAMLGHSDPHIRHMLGSMLSLHLIRIEDEKGDGKRIYFNPVDIVARTRQLARNHKDLGKLDFEYIDADEFAALVDVDRAKLLNKLARSEFADDIFTFRKSEVMRLLNEKGRKYFVERKIKKPEEFADISDIEFADQNSIFEVLARFDVFDLCKVIKNADEEIVKQKIMASLPRAKRQEVEDEVASLDKLDPIEAGQIGQRIIERVKERMLKGS